MHVWIIDKHYKSKFRPCDEKSLRRRRMSRPCCRRCRTRCAPPSWSARSETMEWSFRFEPIDHHHHHHHHHYHNHHHTITTIITTCILPLLSQFLSCTSSLSVTTRWLRLVNVVLKTVKNEWMKEWIIMTNRMVVFEVEIYLIELSPWSYNSSLGAVLSFSVPINNHDKETRSIRFLAWSWFWWHTQKERVMTWLTWGISWCPPSLDQEPSAGAANISRLIQISAKQIIKWILWQTFGWL